MTIPVNCGDKARELNKNPVAICQAQSKGPSGWVYYGCTNGASFTEEPRITYIDPEPRFDANGKFIPPYGPGKTCYPDGSIR